VYSLGLGQALLSSLLLISSVKGSFQEEGENAPVGFDPPNGKMPAEMKDLDWGTDFIGHQHVYIH
jgi:hypothetical protein